APLSSRCDTPLARPSPCPRHKSSNSNCLAGWYELRAPGTVSALIRGAGVSSASGDPEPERGAAMIDLAVVRAEREEARTPTLKEADDSMLVARFLAGERRAFTELADRYHVRLMNFIQRTI